MTPVEARAKAPPIPLERLRFLAARLHSLGERPLYEFLREIDSGAPLQPRLEAYARIAPLAGFIHGLGGDRLTSARLVWRRR
jgi:hypothetical protein